MNLVPSASNIENSRLAKQGEKPPPGPWTARRMKLRLFQNEVGEWRVQSGKRVSPLPATDYEVSLWMDLQDARERMRQHGIDPVVGDQAKPVAAAKKRRR